MLNTIIREFEQKNKKKFEFLCDLVLGIDMEVGLSITKALADTVCCMHNHVYMVRFIIYVRATCGLDE